MGISMRAMQARALYRTYRLLGPLYYHTVYGRHVPSLLHGFVRRLSHWETRWRGDVPLTGDIWDKQYQEGRWRFLADLPEAARYSLLAGYFHCLKPGGAVLDVACGEGLLLKHLAGAYAYYLGVDVSATAIAQAAAYLNTRTEFVRADAENYTAGRQFDVVVFNECLYYFYDPVRTVERYAATALKPGGVILLSNYLGSSRATRLIERLKACYVPVDECTATHNEHTWSCMAFDPTRRR